MTVVFLNNMQMTVITVSRCSLLAECEHLLGSHRHHLHLRLGGTQHSQVAAVTQHHDRGSVTWRHDFQNLYWLS